MRDGAPLVSIVTPMFNDEKFLRETHDSVVQQTHGDWEWLLVDDDSTDTSAQLAREWAEEDGRIHLLRTHQNSGAAVARNLGIEAARGRYLAFLDADDCWYPEKLDVQLKFMRDREAYFSYTGFRYVDERSVATGALAKPPARMSYERALKNTTILTSTVMLDTARVPAGAVQFPDLRRGQDTALWWRLMRTFGSAEGVPRPMTDYRQRPGSLSANRVTALRRTWHLYREVEMLGLLRSSWYFCHYLYNALRRRRPARS